MKKFNLIYLLIIFILIGCKKENKSVVSKKVKNATEVIQLKPKVKGNFFIYEHDLSMYDESYFMKVSPVIDNRKNIYESDIVLTKKSDTIFNKRINIDSLGQAILKRKAYAEHPEYDKISTEYELRKVVYHNLRASNLYFEATIQSEESKKQLKIIFYLPYRNQDIGKLHILNFGARSFGKNTGEEENSKNRKIKVSK
ncbi:MAG: hypothetical protein JXR05_03205 [Flavobacteriaceae bacterium]